MFPKSFLVLKLVGLAFSLVSKRLILLISAKFHRLTYRPIPNPKNVVVIGGSFAGCFLAKRLSECLPTGYTVVLIEKHSHFHFTWNFPRVTVLKGHESKAFIPYPEKPRDAPDGAYFFKQATVVSIEAGRVKLSDGESIECEYLAIATGSQKRYPGALDANGKLECMRFFAGRQEAIETAQRIVVVGGGAAGVEVAGDIKSKYPEKEVTLVHSRTHLLNTFGEGLHIRTKAALEELGVELYLGERVVKGLGLNGPGEMTLTSGKILKCDLLICCIGQVPNTSLLTAFSPPSISSTGALLVEKTLQLKNSPSPKIFALGDVIDLPGPKLGRAATMQAFLVADNILRMIQGRALKEYKPSMIDGSIELTLGLDKSVTYISDGVSKLLLAKNMKDVDLHAAQA